MTMKPSGYYTSGEFARMAEVSIRTIRFYDKKNILKPSFVNDSGARFYSDSDFAKLQQILLLKYLGFSLDDIKELAIDTTDHGFMLNALSLQKQLVQDRMEQMKLVEAAIDDTIGTIEKEQRMNWSHMLSLIHLTGMEKSFKAQYQNANNISARIRLHRKYSVNKQGWFPWIYENCHLFEGMQVLEIGCGNGSLWVENMDQLPENISVILSDISEGMVRDARRSIGSEDKRFQFEAFDCHDIPKEDQVFDLVIGNHMLFYCDHMEKVCKEVGRVLKEGGVFICGTYGKDHMKEITELVQAFDRRIFLAAENLSHKFGLENGKEVLKKYFSEISCELYEDSMELNQGEPLIEYILSCHGNQNQILLDKYKEFKIFVDKQVKKGFHITKDAGIFICQK